MKLLRNRLFLLGWTLASSQHTGSAFLSVLYYRKIPYYDYKKVKFYSGSRARALLAKPKRGGMVDSYQTVSVNCAKCGEKLFRYKKKNGTKTNLVKCYVERISEDSAGLLEMQESSGLSIDDFRWSCPKCENSFARPALVHGRPALKMIGGKVRMTKK
jgi:ribosomal protein L37AE/L43A